EPVEAIAGGVDQFDPVKRELTHVDLMVVEPDREIVMDVPVEPRGEAEGEELGGRLQIMHPEVPVRCTPTTVPDSIPVDIEELGPNDTISASELDYPEGIEPEFKNDYAVLRIMMPRTGVVGLEPEGPEAEEEEEVEEGEEVEAEEEAEAEEADEEESEGAEQPPGAAPPGA
ncbi:MAG: 50S ribosomal protein L25, partial [Bradymonadaceae bacterium]